MVEVLVHAGFNEGKRYVVRLMIDGTIEAVWALPAVGARPWGKMDPIRPPQAPWLPDVGSVLI